MQNGVKKKAVSGMAWTAMSRFATQFIQFVIGIIIARVLLPSDYGIVGMLAIFMAVAQSFVDSGFANALIQKKDRKDIDFSTTFFFNTFLSLLLYGLFFISAPWIAAFYNMPILTDVARVVSLSLIINGLTIVQTAKLTIDLNFRLQAIASILSVLISGGIGIFLAYTGWGVWALVYQGVASALTRCVILWVYSRWMPSFVFSLDSFRKLFSFGSKILCSGLINTVYNNLYTLVIGKAFSPAEVGFYTRGNHFVSLPSQTIRQAVTKVNYPILASLQDNNEELISTYRKLLRTPLFILYPIIFGMAVLAEPMVLVLLGEKWLPCVPILQVLCFGVMWNPLTHINLNLLYVKGRSDLVLRLELIKKPIAFLILFSMIPFGVIWMCVGNALYDFIAFTFNCYYTKKMLNYGFFDQMKELVPIILRVLVMCVGIFITIYFIDSSFLKLITGIIVGLIIYLFLSAREGDQSYLELKKILLKKTSKGL